MKNSLKYGTIKYYSRYYRKHMKNSSLKKEKTILNPITVLDTINTTFKFAILISVCFSSTTRQYC